MKEDRYYLALDDSEQSIIIKALNDMRTDLIQNRKSSDAVNDLIIKVGKAPLKKFKVVEIVEQTAR
jgi:hypothetical protein